MAMNRRGFLSTLLGGAAMALDPERLLWVPGKKLISIPKPQGIDLELIRRYYLNPAIAEFIKQTEAHMALFYADI